MSQNRRMVPALTSVSGTRPSIRGGGGAAALRVIGLSLAVWMLVHCAGARQDWSEVDAGATTTGTPASTEAAVRAAWVRAVQSGAGPAYAFAPLGGDDNGWTSGGGATLDARAATRVEIVGDHVRMRGAGAGGAGWLGLRVFGIGRGGDLHPLGKPTVHAKGNRVELRRVEAASVAIASATTPVVEWYEHGPLGLEQGFVLAGPVAEGHGALSIAIALTGASETTVRVRDQQTAVVESGGGQMRVRDLSARDAIGRGLPAWMETDGTVLYLRVDDRGARYPIEIDPLYTSIEDAKLTAGDATTTDYFGYSVSLSGDTALVGAYGKASPTSCGFPPCAVVAGGAAYVFLRAGSTWTQQAKLIASDAVAGDSFGYSVSLSGDTALVGAYGRLGGCGFCGTTGPTGVAYVFIRAGTTWTQQAKLMASDAAPGDSFGYSVSLSGNTALVGAYGKASNAGVAYVFVRSGIWAQQAILKPSVAPSGAQFGWSVSLSGDTALVGANQDGKGAAYAFLRTGTAWTQQAKLTASDAAAGDSFGYSVSLSGDTALVGASGKAASTGAAYAFLRSGIAWTEQAKIAASDAATGDRFGSSVALSADLALVGAYGSTSFTGAAYAFARAGTTWTQQLKLTASDAAVGDRFGSSVALAGNTELVGASSKATNTGAAYVSRLIKPAGSACLTGAECVSTFCADSVCCDKACTGDCEACSAAKKGGADGTCELAAADSNPRGKCVVDLGYPTSCQADGMCDGAGSCRKYAKKSTACGPTTCTAGSVSGKLCNGGGTCETLATLCDPYVCGPTTCKTACATEDDCAAGAYCASGSACAPKKKSGGACASAKECISAYCVDSVCCNVSCTAQCEGCAEPGNEGSCIPVSGAPRGSRSKCAGDPTVCGGSCDGSSAASCKLAPSTKACGSVCTDGTETPSTCDGLGACSPGKGHECSPYTCADPTRCRDKCAADSECAAGYSCNAGKCAPKGSAKCSDDGKSSIGSDGVPSSCAPYLCDKPSGLCLKQCATTGDCAPGNACNATGKCEPASAAAAQAGGCGCELGAGSDVGSGDGAAGAWSVVVVALSLLRRRRQVTPSARPLRHLPIAASPQRVGLRGAGGVDRRPRPAGLLRVDERGGKGQIAGRNSLAHEVAEMGEEGRGRGAPAPANRYLRTTANSTSAIANASAVSGIRAVAVR